MFGPASNCVTPPLEANEALNAWVANEAVVANELEIANELVTALDDETAKDAVPNKEPVNPWVAITDPVTWNCEPDANTRLLLFAPCPVPFPIIKADCADDDILNWPWTCW